jgi:hypothetical protein
MGSPIAQLGQLPDAPLVGTSFPRSDLLLRSLSGLSMASSGSRGWLSDSPVMGSYGSAKGLTVLMEQKLLQIGGPASFQAAAALADSNMTRGCAAASGSFYLPQQQQQPAAGFLNADGASGFGPASGSFVAASSGVNQQLPCGTAAFPAAALAAALGCSLDQAWVMSPDQAAMALEGLLRGHPQSAPILMRSPTHQMAL